jgi:hypothetical protein
MAVALTAAFTLAFAPALLAQAPASAPATAKAADTASGPKLVVPESKKDVGTVPKGEPIKHVFVLRNTGKADLHVTDVKPSCGCTVPEFDKVIKPGAEGKVTLTVDTKNFSGPISKTALLMTDDPSMPQTTLFLSANVKPFVEALPYGFFRITALSGEAASSEVVLVSDESEFKPTKIETPNSFLKATLSPVPEKELIKDKNPNQWKITLTAAPDAPEGILGGTVKVATGVKRQPEIEISVSGFVKPAVTKVETNVPGISAEIVPVDKSRVQVVLTVDQKIKKGVFEGELLIKTTDKAKSDVKVPLKGVIL